MATHDYVIANGTGAAVRSDLNGALAAIVSQNSSATEPSPTYAYQRWADTTAGVMKMRNGANNAWISLYELDGTFLAGDISLSAGAAATPSLFFTGDTNTGIYSPGADQVGISTGGTSRLAVSTTAVSSTLAVDHPLGAVGTPSITFTGDLNTGIWSPGADQVAISTGGTARITIDGSGNVNIDSNTLYVDAANNRVGIGTSSPSGLLTLAWNSSTGINAGLIGQVNNSAGANSGYRIGLRTNTDTTNWCSIDQAFTNLGVNADTYIAFTTTSSSNTAAERMRLTSTGLGIGTTASNTNGGILQLSGGITFPATAVAASDPNTLDDYEEGTWTPNQGGGLTVVGTFVSSGTYTKIGRQLFISGQMSATTIAVAAGGIISTNLPFSTTGYGAGGVGNFTLTNGAVLITASLSIYSVAAVGASGGIEFAATCIV